MRNSECGISARPLRFPTALVVLFAFGCLTDLADASNNMSWQRGRTSKTTLTKRENTGRKTIREVVSEVEPAIHDQLAAEDTDQPVAGRARLRSVVVRPNRGPRRLRIAQLPQNPDYDFQRELGESFDLPADEEPVREEAVVREPGLEFDTGDEVFNTGDLDTMDGDTMGGDTMDSETRGDAGLFDDFESTDVLDREPDLSAPLNGFLQEEEPSREDGLGSDDSDESLGPLDDNLLSQPGEQLQPLPRETPPRRFEPLPPRTDLPDLELDSTIHSSEEERQMSEELCAEELRDLKSSTIADVDLNISIRGVEGEDFPYQCAFEEGEAVPPRCWPQVTFMWRASALYHKPLYFEEVGLERYGHTCCSCVQPIVSSAHFFARLPVLPYCIGYTPPCECQYALGHYRPGNCAPRMIPAVPISVRGGLMEAGAVVGAAVVIP